MYRKRKKIFFELPVIIIAAIFLFGFIVMLLWNFIFPPVLHTEKISYWQAVGLLVLCRILFFGLGRRYKDRRPDMFRGGTSWRQKWMNMSDEERVKFREEWRKRCGRPHKEQ
jgi:hypothetical protein